MSSPITVQWWSRIDREAVLSSVQSLVRDPKLFAIVGDVSSGLNEAASLAQEEFERLGRRCIRLSDLDVVLPTPKYRLLKLLDSLAYQRQAGLVLPSILLSSSHIGTIRANLSRELSSLNDPICLVFDRLDSQECPRRNEIFQLQELARVSNTPVIFTGDSQYRWSSLVPPSSIVQLGTFTRVEVRACMLSAPPLAQWSNIQIDKELDKIFAAANHISPLEAFTRLKVLAA